VFQYLRWVITDRTKPYDLGVKRQWTWAFDVALVAAGLGALLWRTGSVGRSGCALQATLGKGFVPTLYAQCHQAHHDISAGVVLLAVGLFAMVVSFMPVRAEVRWWRARAAAMPAPAGWMRVPLGWRPVNGRFMPVPPGWPQPPADWVAPEGWVPPPTWPLPPTGWPRPESRSPAEVKLAMAAARAVYVIGLVVVGLDVAYPLQMHGVGALLLLWPVWIALICLINLGLSFRGLRVYRPYDVAIFVGIWALLYADIDVNLDETPPAPAAAAAFVSAAVVFALALLLRKYRPARATALPKNLWLQQALAQVPPAPSSDASTAGAPDD
jgi:hypothetical protein